MLYEGAQAEMRGDAVVDARQFQGIIKPWKRRGLGGMGTPRGVAGGDVHVEC